MTRIQRLNLQVALLCWGAIGAGCQAETPTAQPQQAAAVVPPAAQQDPASIEEVAFGQTPDGTPVTLYVCTNARGNVLKMTNFGATVVALEMPDRHGQRANINLGFDRLDGYLGDHPYFGATVGRYANRIAQGRFTLDGQEYTLATNDGPNHLHGGDVPFHQVVWQAEPFRDDSGTGVRFHYSSPDGEEGYPGNLEVTAVYTLTDQDELIVAFTATTDQPTPVNLTNHNYWNLRGEGAGTIREHLLFLPADYYLPVDETLIPTGERVPVQNTPMDFTEPHEIGSRLDQIVADPVGYDHCYVLREEPGDLRLAARVHEPHSGRVMEIHTTKPGLQFYSGNFLDGSAANGGYQQYEGFCLETQFFPDSPNQPDFPDTILRPGQQYEHTTIHRFSAE